MQLRSRSRTAQNAPNRGSEAFLSVSDVFELSIPSTHEELFFRGSVFISARCFEQFLLFVPNYRSHSSVQIGCLGVCSLLNLPSLVVANPMYGAIISFARLDDAAKAPNLEHVRFGVSFTGDHR